MLRLYSRQCHTHTHTYVRKRKQEAQLSQRDRATLRVIEYFAKSGHSRSFEITLLSRVCVSPY